VLGCITAVGGGMIRDVLIGNTPPLIFSNYSMLLLALVISVLVFLLAYFQSGKLWKLQEKTALIINFFDALGLAAFSVSGIEIAAAAGYADAAGVAIAMGVVTGIGGGVLRDVLADGIPSILTKQVYAVVSVFGCILYYVIRTYTPYRVFGTILVMVLMVLIRMLAMLYRWSLPKIDRTKTVKKG